MSFEITSFNPAKNFEPVFTTKSNLSQVEIATTAAQKAFVPWSSKSQQERNALLLKVKDALIKREAEIAKAITLEMGKPIAESEAEAKNLSARIDLTIRHALPKVATERVDGLRGEARYHAQGPVAVLGPYNFPAHLVNAHVIPALLTGNTVVVKPSEVCPLVAQLYAECMKEAGLPDGVYNMVQGSADIGKALIQDPRIRAVLFTGSYATGRAIKETLLDHPHKIAALEMGGKNIAVVLDDADLYQALSEILQGAFLTTGQRCTATSRVFVQRQVADQFISSLVNATRSLKPSDPMNRDCAFGPLATKSSLERYMHFLEQAPKSGAEVLLKGETLSGGAFVTPSLHLLKKVQEENSYLREELFGPDICIEIIDDLDDAISRTNKSSYGLSNALFSASQSAFEKFYRETSSGVLNLNRSTNGALGQLPFGGVGKSGNQRAAGIDAVRYTTYPVAINHLPYGETEPTSTFANALREEHDSLDICVDTLVTRHRLESFLALRGIQIHDARGKSVLIANKKFESIGTPLKDVVEALTPYAYADSEYLWLTVPQDHQDFTAKTETYFGALCEEKATDLLRLPRASMQVPPCSELPQSAAMLHRLYKDNFLPREKKTPIIDLGASKGPYLCSIDDEPLVLFDAASQIASLGAGFKAGSFLDALDTDQLTSSIIANTENEAAIKQYSEQLLEHSWPSLKHVTFTSSGAEANEKAIDLCRLNGTKGKRVIAFEGSFHGRTLLALQATFNPQKRGLFEFAGYEATFVPFPYWLTPAHEPDFSPSWVQSWFTSREIPKADGDDLLAREIESLLRVKAEIEKGDVACVIVEPMQCEGGDNYATARFFNGLRALTRGLGIPLIFDEVQTGFGLLGPFFAHTAFNLRDAHGNLDGPDCVTMAKKAQLGVVLSSWPDARPQPCHTLQVQRGMLHAQAMGRFDVKDIHTYVLNRLAALEKDYPDFISHPRAKAYAFAFDLPTAHLATQIINQRFYRGYMVYVAGEKTMRFRLNTKTTTAELDQLFVAIRQSFEDVKKHVAQNKDIASYVAPAWKNAQPIITNTEPTTNYSFLKLTPETFDKYQPQIAKLEEEVYEPGRRDSMEYLRGFVTLDDGLALLMLDSDNNAIGYAIGGPLEHSHVDGPKQDPLRGSNRAFYSTNVLVAPKVRGQKLGFAIKKAQIEHVRQMKAPDGKPRYDYLCGRNRVGFTAEMSAVNRMFGAYTVTVYDNQYGEGSGAKALYYRIALRAPMLNLKKPAKASVLDWSSPIQAPFGSAPDALFEDLSSGIFTSAIATKLTLSNFITPDFVRYGELLRKLAPKACKHVYFTSGRDEVNDKAIRCLRVSRPKGQIAIGLRQQFFGTTTAVSRSLTESDEFASPFGWFDWPLVAHPASSTVSIDSIKEIIANQGAEQVLGIFIELIGEKTANTLSESFLIELDNVRKETGVPIAFVETASALGRNGQTLFYSDQQPIKPNLVLWYTGAQLGHLFTDDHYYVAKPLTLISTWDGDEISIRRNYRHMLLARNTLKSGLASKFEELIASKGLTDHLTGIGLWRSASKPHLIDEARKRGLILAAGFKGRTMITPHLGSTLAELEEGVDILRGLL